MFGTSISSAVRNAAPAQQNRNDGLFNSLSSWMSGSGFGGSKAAPKGGDTGIGSAIDSLFGSGSLGSAFEELEPVTDYSKSPSKPSGSSGPSLPYVDPKMVGTGATPSSFFDGLFG